MEWIEIDNMLTKDFECVSFIEAVKFVIQVADIAEQMNHHPDIRIHDVNKVTIQTFTHTDNKVTEKDRNLAKGIDAIANPQ